MQRSGHEEGFARETRGKTRLLTDPAALTSLHLLSALTSRDPACAIRRTCVSSRPQRCCPRCWPPQPSTRWHRATRLVAGWAAQSADGGRSTSSTWNCDRRNICASASVCMETDQRQIVSHSATERRLHDATCAHLVLCSPRPTCTPIRAAAVAGRPNSCTCARDRRSTSALCGPVAPPSPAHTAEQRTHGGTEDATEAHTSTAQNITAEQRTASSDTHQHSAAQHTKTSQSPGIAVACPRHSA